jgi:hypothetical protein
MYYTSESRASIVIAFVIILLIREAKIHIKLASTE